MRIRTIITTALLAFSVFATAQKKAGDYIESVNNNVDQSRSPREMQYAPKDGAFFCVNGKNRFTRALYGSHSDYRIETSDRPIFALYKPKNYRSLALFSSLENGQSFRLDEVEYCEATYKDGIRSYLLRDSRWGKDATLYIDLLASHDTDGGVIRIKGEGISKPVELSAHLCDIANKKLHRNGDMGADKPGCFEPSSKEDNLTVVCAEVKNGKTIYGLIDFLALQFEEESVRGKSMFEASSNYYKELCSRFTISTPDPYLNTLGGAMMLAADGVWDGETWLHGAIGWRMPLAGWRAGFLGDLLGWNDRAVSHFDAYAASQVTDVPIQYSGARQDSALCLARAEKKWGTEMYSNGYICRNPNRNNQMHHYDMNLNYIDELLWHFEYDADTAYMRKMWPVIQRHLTWEKLNFDSDNDHLYDAYCCIWASDALYYADGAVTHSSAYNYRGNLLAAKIARIIGEDPQPYQQEAEAILKAINERLWLSGDAAYVPSPSDINRGKKSVTPPHWAEYQESMGNGRTHADAALWSVYTPIDCGVGTPQQQYSATRYVTEHIPHIPVVIKGESPVDFTPQLISTSDWMPYAWSINNVASAEIMHMALAYFKAGNARDGYRLVKSNILDQMYLGQSPGNFGQISYYDAARGECYRDFGDNVGISCRALIQGLIGIVPNALDGRCVIRPGFPLDWEKAEFSTPYLSYKYERVSASKARLTIEQNFTRPLAVVVRINDGDSYHDFLGTKEKHQEILVDIPYQKDDNIADNHKADVDNLNIASLGLSDISLSDKAAKQLKPQAISKSFNASVTDIFNNEYLSPRPSSTSLQLPVQGVGEWCHPKFKPEINDSVFRSLSKGNRIVIDNIPFFTPQNGQNIVFTSLWDNYPSEVTIPVKTKKAEHAYLLMTGSTQHMQTHMDNALVIANYSDGTADTLHVIPPFNWCPIEQDYYVDGMAFDTVRERPLRVSLGTGKVSRNLGKELNISQTEVYGREIGGGAAQVLVMPLNADKKVQSFTLRTVSCDVVIGIMAITL